MGSGELLVRLVRVWYLMWGGRQSITPMSMSEYGNASISVLCRAECGVL